MKTYIIQTKLILNFKINKCLLRKYLCFIGFLTYKVKITQRLYPGKIKSLISKSNFYYLYCIIGDWTIPFNKKKWGVEGDNVHTKMTLP